jgi:hypothetical protein
MNMSPAEDRRERLMLLFLPALILLLGCGASLVPQAALEETVVFLTAWISLSIPLAVLFGHCALSED